MAALSETSFDLFEDDYYSVQSDQSLASRAPFLIWTVDPTATITTSTTHNRATFISTTPRPFIKAPPKSGIIPASKQHVTSAAPTIFSDFAPQYPHVGFKSQPNGQSVVEPTHDHLLNISTTVDGFNAQLALLNAQEPLNREHTLCDSSTSHSESQHLIPLQTLSKEAALTISTLQDEMMLHGRLIKCQSLQHELDALQSQREDILVQLKRTTDEKINLRGSSTVLPNHEDELERIKRQKITGLEMLEQCKMNVREKEVDLAPAQLLVVSGLPATASVHDKVARQEIIVNDMKSSLKSQIEALQKRIAFLPLQLRSADSLRLCKEAYAADDHATVLQFVHQFAPHNSPDALYYQGALHYYGRFNRPSPAASSESSHDHSQDATSAGADPPDYQAAHDCWFEAATLGHLPAQNRLAALLYVGKLGSRDLQGAHQWLTQAANAGHADSQFRLATPYQQGSFGAAPDYNVVRDLFIKAADQGHVRAQFDLSRLYYSGDLGIPDHRASLELLAKAVEQRHVDARTVLSWFYSLYTLGALTDEAVRDWFAQAESCERDAIVQVHCCSLYSSTFKCNHQAARDWFTKAAEQGRPDAQTVCGFLYRSNHLGSPNDKAARDWFTKAAEQGYALAQFELGCMYYSDDLGVPNYDTALKWLTKAAKQGQTDAQIFLSELYRSDDVRVPGYHAALEWIAKAAKEGHSRSLYNQGDRDAPISRAALWWYTKAAEQGDVGSQCNLGRLYRTKQLGPPNHHTARDWLTKAAEQGHADAQYRLGLLYKLQVLGAPDYNAALAWFTKAAEQGHALAQFALGYVYEFGDFGEPNYQAARDWYTKAAEQGNASAQTNLGILYSAGRIAPDYDAARDWLTKSARQNHISAQYSLGLLYETGLLGDPDYKVAHEWYTKAANQGDADALEQLKQPHFCQM